jgi:hypothetical protein
VMHVTCRENRGELMTLNMIKVTFIIIHHHYFW